MGGVREKQKRRKEVKKTGEKKTDGGEKRKT